jgi:DNA-binding response OmpR family regulator
MKTILVVGREWKFRALLRAQLLEEGYAALGFETLEEAAAQVSQGEPPAALVFDTTDALPGSFQPQLAALAGRLPVVVVAAADESLDTAGARILHRPLRLEDVMAELRAVLVH